MAIGGLVALLVLPGLAGLSIPPIIGQLRLGTPVDFDQYNRNIRAILHLRMNETAPEQDLWVI